LIGAVIHTLFSQLIFCRKRIGAASGPIVECIFVRFAEFVGDHAQVEKEQLRRVDFGDLTLRPGYFGFSIVRLQNVRIRVQPVNARFREPNPAGLMTHDDGRRSRRGQRVQERRAFDEFDTSVGKRIGDHADGAVFVEPKDNARTEENFCASFGRAEHGAVGDALEDSGFVIERMIVYEDRALEIMNGAGVGRHNLLAKSVPRKQKKRAEYRDPAHANLPYQECISDEPSAGASALGQHFAAGQVEHGAGNEARFVGG
jgi:hypothetical protein